MKSFSLTLKDLHLIFFMTLFVSFLSSTGWTESKNTVGTCLPEGENAPHRIIARLCERVDSCVGDDNNNATCNWTALSNAEIWDKMGLPSAPKAVVSSRALEVQREIRSGKISVNEANLCRCLERISRLPCDQIITHFSPTNAFADPENLIASAECGKVLSMESSN